MAEERIVCRVIEKGPNCDYCFSKPAESYYYCSISNNYCSYDVCKQCSLGMTRAEAIEKMCEGYFKAKDNGLTESERVEAALNALLEGK